jgi:hypothetical protein
MFSAINTEGDIDKYLNYEEFQEAIPQFLQWGIEIIDPKKIFNDLDSNKEEKISFQEFCNWAIKNYLDINFKDNENNYTNNINGLKIKSQIEENLFNNIDINININNNNNSKIKQLEERLKFLEVK